MPATTAGALDEVIAGGYFDLALSGMDTVKFSDVSGLTHSVNITSQMLSSEKAGALQDARVVGSPQPVELTCKYVVLKSVELWTWLDTLIQEGASDKTAKEGSLFIKSIAANEIVATWKLSQVFLTTLALGDMGASSSEFLIADLTFTVGECAPM
jgi:hypothetical protein